MEERLSWGEVPRQPKLQSSRSGSGWGEAQRGTAFIGARLGAAGARSRAVPARWEHRAARPSLCVTQRPHSPRPGGGDGGGAACPRVSPGEGHGWVPPGCPGKEEAVLGDARLAEDGHRHAWLSRAFSIPSPTQARSSSLSTSCNHRTAPVGRHLKDHSVPTPYCGQGCHPMNQAPARVVPSSPAPGHLPAPQLYLMLDQAGSSNISRVSLEVFHPEHLQGWSIHNLSGQLFQHLTALSVKNPP